MGYAQTPPPPEVDSPHVKDFLASYQAEKAYNRQQESTSVLQVSRAASAFALVYERLRQAIDYQDESVLRRKAIARILLRRVTRSKEAPRVIAESLIKEVAWARYIDIVIPTEKVEEISKILEKYIYLLQHNAYRQSKQLPDIRDWLIGICATEIERALVPPFVPDALALLMYKTLDFSEPISGVDEATKSLQVYLTIQRALLHADLPSLRYQMVVSYHPQWVTHEIATVEAVNNQFVELVQSIEFHLHHPLSDRLFPLVRRQIGSFLILKEICDARKRENLHDILADKTKREESIRVMCAEKYGLTRAKIARAVVRSIIYLFITKSLLALALEVPVERALSGKIHIIPLAVNVGFPPILMALVALGIRVPGEKNTLKIVDRINALVDDKDGTNAVKLRMPPIRKRGYVFYIAYLVMFSLSFGLASYVLMQIGATFFSALLFFFFTCLVSFFAYRIQNTAREYVVVDERGTLVSGLFDFLFFPFMRIGRWLSEGISKINIFIFIFDFILEAPVKTLVGILEDWFSFIREKKDEIV